MGGQIPGFRQRRWEAEGGSWEAAEVLQLADELFISSNDFQPRNGEQTFLQAKQHRLEADAQL